MAHSSLAKLLILQERDQRFAQLTGQLRQWPEERKSTERDIRTERARIESAEAAVQELELRRKELEGSVADAEERIVKYRTQQLAVKKQEEYTALESEITTLREMIDEWETVELDVLDGIDHAQADLEKVKNEVAANVATLEAHLRTIDEGLAQNQAQVGEAEAELASARTQAEADAGAIGQYDFVRAQVKRFPIIVPLEGGKCKGCHLRVSSEVESAARRDSEIARCSSCGRIVYID